MFGYKSFIGFIFVKENCKDALTIKYLEEIGELGNEVLGKTKEPSTIKAKAKAIYNWVMKNYNGNGVNNWNYKRKTKNDEELKMTKQELALKNSQERARRTKEKVYKAIKQLKENKEKVTSQKIMEIAKVSKNSALKYMRQAREEGII